MPSEPGEGVFELQQKLEKKAAEARTIAEKVGEIIGWVSPYRESQAGTGGTKFTVVVEVDKYFLHKNFIARPGAILAAVDLLNLDVISLKVVGAMRTDFYSSLGETGALTPYPMVHDVRGLLAKPQLLVEPLLAFRFEGDKLTGGKAADYVIEPRSPVVVPKPEYLETLIGVKGKIVLGALTIGEEPIRSRESVARALIPLEDLLYHTLVVGTTGSGKTTFVKNLIRSLLDHNVAVVCVDENGDYVQTIFDPIWDIEKGSEEEELAKQLYGAGFQGLKKVTVILPVTKYFVEGCKDLKCIARKYYKLYLERLHQEIWRRSAPFLGSLLGSLGSGEPRINVERLSSGHPVANLYIEVPSKRGGVEERVVRIVPYAMVFTNVSARVAELYPYFTALAREGIPNVIEAFREDRKREKLIYELKRKKVTLEGSLRSVNSLEDLVQNLNTIYTNDRAVKVCAEYCNVHKSTLDNIRRGLSRFYEMGIFDVKVGNEMIGEPEVESIVEGGALAVLDLRPLSELKGLTTITGAKRILALRLLKRILEWKMQKEFEETPTTIVLVDEAHRFFPRTAEEGERVR